MSDGVFHIVPPNYRDHERKGGIEKGEDGFLEIASGNVMDPDGDMNEKEAQEHRSDRTHNLNSEGMNLWQKKKLSKHQRPK